MRFCRTICVLFFAFFFFPIDVCQAGIKGVSWTSGPKPRCLTFPSNSQAWMIYDAILRFLSCILSTLWNVDRHINLVTLRDIKTVTEDWQRRKKKRIIFVWRCSKQSRSLGRWVEFCSSQSTFQHWTEALCLSNHGLPLSLAKEEKHLWLNWCTCVAFFTREAEQSYYWVLKSPEENKATVINFLSSKWPISFAFGQKKKKR